MQISTKYEINEIDRLCRWSELVNGALVQTWVEGEPTIAMVCQSYSQDSAWRALVPLSGTKAFTVHFPDNYTQASDSIDIADLVVLNIQLQNPTIVDHVPVGYVLRAFANSKEEAELYLSIYSLGSGQPTYIKLSGEDKGKILLTPRFDALMLGPLGLDLAKR